MGRGSDNLGMRGRRQSHWSPMRERQPAPRRLGGFYAAIFIIFAGSAAPVKAVEEGHDWLRFLGALNRPSLLEPAGAHGTIGTTMGLGAESVATSDGAAPIAEREMNTAPEMGGNQQVPMAWLVKGTPWPVDLGISVGAAPDASFTLAAGHAQVTVFEEFGMPALSVRAGYSRVYGLAKTTLATTAADAVLSYGFLRYFSVYGAVGVARTQASYDDQEVGWTDARRAVGLKVMVLPPLVSVTAEASFDGGQVQTAAAKLSVGI